MAFDADYSQYLERAQLPSLSYNRLHSLLLECPRQRSPSLPRSSHCSVCDETFFPVIEKELIDVLRYFNTRVRWLLRFHLASGVKKCVFLLKHKQARNRLAMVQEGQLLVNYVSMMTRATRRLLEEYDKVHVSSEGQKFKTRLVTMHVEALKSPLFVELLALYFNLKAKGTRPLPEICPESVCDLQSSKPTLSCMPHETLKLEFDITCSICLGMVFEPVALKCGHIFCFSCACSTASLLPFEGLKKAKKNVACPLCREIGVFTGAIPLTELNLLINRSCKDYWKKRFQRERKERMEQAKEYWSDRSQDVGTAVYTMW